MRSTGVCGGVGATIRLTIACVAIASATGGAAGQATYRLLRVVDNTISEPLARPVGLTHAPGDYKRVFVWQKGGVIRVMDITTNPLPTVGPGTATVGTLGPAFVTVNSYGNTSASDERGLLGLAFHPQYMTNGKFYVNYTYNTGSTSNPVVVTRVSEFINGTYDAGTMTWTPTPNSNTANPASERVLVQFSQIQSNHKGGWIAFGPDGYLYWSQGDGGGQGDGLDGSGGHNTTCSGSPSVCVGTGNGQSLGTLLGKILRINVNGTGVAPEGGVTGPNPGAYTVPADNPFVGVAGAKDEIWAYGLRNPWRNSFDRLTGDLWIADVGQDTYEEIDFQPAITPGNQASVRGRNYGWRCYEGTVLFSTAPNTTGCASGYDSGGATGPVGMYAHYAVGGTPDRLFSTSLVTGCSIIGGYVYRGCAIPALQGLYVFTDYCKGRIYTTSINTTTGVLSAPTLLSSVWTGSEPPMIDSYYPHLPTIPGTYPSNSLVSFGEDAYGELYVLDETSNRIYKFVPIVADQVPLGNADASRDGFMTIDDIFVYLNQWFSLQNQADYDRDGSVTINDIFAYLNAWFRGSCPF